MLSFVDSLRSVSLGHPSPRTALKRTFPTVLVCADTPLLGGSFWSRHSGEHRAPDCDRRQGCPGRNRCGSPRNWRPGARRQLDRPIGCRNTDWILGRSAHLVATEIAVAVPLDVDALLAAWQTTSLQRLRVMFTALSQVGTAYRYGGNTPSGFDCSGLTSYAWASVGVRLPRTPTQQIEQAVPRDLGQLRPGDVLWRPGHIGMSLGIPDVMVNATQTGRPVEVKRWGRVTRSGSLIVD